METRDGLVEFRVSKIQVLDKKQRPKIKKILEYRQCFKGLWAPWKQVPVMELLRDD